MKVIIEFDCGNAAFSDDFYAEMSRILAQAKGKVMHQLDRAPGCVCTAPEAGDKLLDSNGNTAGTVQVLP